LTDIEELDFPHDVMTYNYNLPQPAAFNEYVKPFVDEMLQTNAEKSIENLPHVKGFSMGGSNIQKETVRVFLGLYRVVYRYGDQEYSMWSTGDGQKILCDAIPTDPQRQKIQTEKQAILESVPTNNTGACIGGLVVCAIAAVGSFFLLPAQLETLGAVLVGLLFTAGAIMCGVMIPSASRVGKERDEERASAQKDLDDFNAQLPTVVRRFKEQKKPLRGIYAAEVAGDAGAF